MSLGETASKSSRHCFVKRSCNRQVWKERSAEGSLPSAARKVMLTETAALTTVTLCCGLQYWSMSSTSPGRKMGFAVGGTVQTREAGPAPKTLQCGRNQEAEDPMEVQAWEHSTAVFSAFN